MKFKTYFRAMEISKILMNNMEQSRRQGTYGIAVADDWKALRWQKYNRQYDKFSEKVLRLGESYEELLG